MSQSDQDLMALIRGRDEEAFEQLVSRFGEVIRIHLIRMVRNETAAGDLYQEVLVRVWRNAAQWEARGALKAWLLRIATNLALNHLQAKQRRGEIPLDIPRDNPSNTDESDEDHTLVPRWMIDPDANPDLDIEMTERSERLRRTIASLPPEKRTVFYLAHHRDLDMQEISDLLGIPVGTVKSRLHYTMRNLLKTLDDMTTDTED